MLDTHILAWLAIGRDRLTRHEREAIALHGGDLVVSTISIWELRLKWRSHPRRSAEDSLLTPDAALAFCEAREIPIIPFTAADAAHDLVPPPANSDPFDEALLGHAQRIGAALLTRDRNLVGHPLAYRP